MGEIRTNIVLKDIYGGIPIGEVEALRDSTKIGETISFRSDRYYK